MLNDPSDYSSSNWQNDFPLFSGCDLDILEASIEKMRDGNNARSEMLPPSENNLNSSNLAVHNMHNNNLPSSQVSLPSSSASSESDFHDLFPALTSDDLDGTIFNHMLMDNQPNVDEWNNLMLSDNSFEVDAVSVEDTSVVSATPPPSPQHKRKRKQTTKKAKSAADKRKSAVEQLHHIISTQLGLREQLDVLRIINPHSTISPTDKHFVLDLDNVSDSKLEAVKEYVRVHNSGSSHCKQPNRNCQSKQQNTAALTKKQKAAQQKEERQRLRKQEMEAIQRQRKANRQIQKEKRSGLFKREQEVLIGTEDNVDNDIDILS